jgi:hypothetical protein
MRCVRRAASLLCLAAGILAVPRAALADHDDGDDVKEYAYVLRFDAKELSAFSGYVVLDRNESEPRFQGFRRISRRSGAGAVGASSAADLPLLFEGDIPVTIEAIPGPGLVGKVEAWVRKEAGGSPDAVTSFGGPEALAKFEAAFGGEVHRLDYAPSALLGKLLGLARCRVHFLEEPKDRLKSVVEYVNLRYTAPRKARIVPSRYVLTYDDGTSVELSTDKAARLTGAECRMLLNPKNPQADGSRSLSGAWHVGAPAFSAAMLAFLAVRRRRDGA